MHDASSKPESSIRFSNLRPGLVRRSSVGSSAAPALSAKWIACGLLAIAHLTGCGITYNTIPLTANPGSVTFGSVQVGNAKAVNVAVKNEGLSAVALSGIQVADPAFQLTPAAMPATIPAGGSANVTVTFAPAAAKNYSSQLVIASAAGQTTIDLSGIGQQSTQHQPPPVSPALELSATSLQFGSVPIGGDAQQSLTLTSSGTAPLQISALNAIGVDFSAVAPALPLTLQPGQTLSLPVKFGPTGSGAKTGQLVIASDAAAAPSMTVSLTGSGATQPPPPPTTPTPALTLSESAVDFGSVTIGSKASSSVTLTSSGTAAVVLQSLTVSGAGFSAGHVPLPLTLAPGQQIVLPLTFAPSVVGSQQGQVTLADNATGSPSSVSLTGNGVAPAPVPSLSAPPSVDFGDVTVGSEGSRTITLISNGTGAVTVKSIRVAGAEFSDAPVVLPQVLQPNQQMSVKVKFDPKAEGNAGGTVTVGSDAASSPTVQIHGTGVVASTPSLSASATSLSFGQVLVGSQATKTVTVSSTGTAPATISAGTVTGASYTATYAGVPVGNLTAPITLQPGQQVIFSVTFDPTKPGTAPGQLSLATDTGAPVNVALTGEGKQGTSPALTVSVPSLNFGDVQVGSNAVQQLTLTSSGTAPVTISSAAIAGQQFKVSSVAYPAGVNGWPAALNPGEQVTLSITFTPNVVDSFSGDLALASDASGGTANVPLSGNGQAVPAPRLTLSTASINFGQVQIGAKPTRSLTLTSSGNAPLDINTITVAGARFSLGTLQLPATLQPGQQMTVTVTYEPTAAGPDAGTLTVTSSDTSGPGTVSLGGDGTTTTVPQLTVSPAAVNFGSTPLNVPVTQPVTLTSTGTAAVTISAATASGPGFSVSGATFPVTLNPNQSVTLQAKFDPTVAGAAAGQLTLNSNSASGATTNVALSGTGTVTTTPQLTVSPAAVNFGSTPLNVPVTQPVTLTSTGTAAVTISAATASGPGFSVSGATFPVTLNPNQSVTLQAKFDPTVAGAATGQLTVSSDSASGGTTNVALSGTGTVTTTPQLTVSPAAVNFGSTPLNVPVTQPVTLTSTGTAAVTISAATANGPGFSVSGATFPVTLNPNQSVTLQAKFDPTVAGAAAGQLTVSSNSASGGTTNIALSGTGTVITTPRLTVNPTAVNFGNVAVNSTATLPVTLTSSGTAPVTISAAALTGADFSVTGANFPVTLNPNQVVTVNVQFDPKKAGQSAGQWTITSNSSTGATVVVQLSGTGTVTATPQLLVSAKSLPFGDVPVGSTATLSVTLTSSGTAPVLVSSVALTGTEFSDSGATFPVTLNPNQTATLTVHFDPTIAGAATGTLTISSNSTTGSTAQVSLSGNGTAVQHQIDLSWDPPSSSADPVAGYNIYRSTNGGSFTKLNGSPDSQVTYTDNGVQSGSTYMYEVKSVDASGVESGASNQITLPVP